MVFALSVNPGAVEALDGFNLGQAHFAPQRSGTRHVVERLFDLDGLLVPRHQSQIYAERKSGVGDVGREARVAPGAFIHESQGSRDEFLHFGSAQRVENILHIFCQLSAWVCFTHIVVYHSTLCAVCQERNIVSLLQHVTGSKTPRRQCCCVSQMKHCFIREMRRVAPATPYGVRWGLLPLSPLESALRAGPPLSQAQPRHGLSPLDRAVNPLSEPGSGRIGHFLKLRFSNKSEGFSNNGIPYQC